MSSNSKGNPAVVNTAASIVVPERASVKDLRHWLSNFGQANRQHYEQGQLQLAAQKRTAMLQSRIQSLEASLESSSSSVSTSSSPWSPNKGGGCGGKPWTLSPCKTNLMSRNWESPTTRSHPEVVDTVPLNDNVPQLDGPSLSKTSNTTIHSIHSSPVKDIVRQDMNLIQSVSIDNSRDSPCILQSPTPKTMTTTMTLSFDKDNSAPEDKTDDEPSLSRQSNEDSIRNVSDDVRLPTESPFLSKSIPTAPLPMASRQSSSTNKTASPPPTTTPSLDDESAVSRPSRISTFKSTQLSSSSPPKTKVSPSKMYRFEAVVPSQRSAARNNINSATINSTSQSLLELPEPRRRKGTPTPWGNTKNFHINDVDADSFWDDELLLLDNDEDDLFTAASLPNHTTTSVPRTRILGKVNHRRTSKYNDDGDDDDDTWNDEVARTNFWNHYDNNKDDDDDDNSLLDSVSVGTGRYTDPGGRQSCGMVVVPPKKSRRFRSWLSCGGGGGRSNSKRGGIDNPKKNTTTTDIESERLYQHQPRPPRRPASAMARPVTSVVVTKAPTHLPRQGRHSTSTYLPNGVLTKSTLDLLCHNGNDDYDANDDDDDLFAGGASSTTLPASTRFQRKSYSRQSIAAIGL